MRTLRAMVTVLPALWFVHCDLVQKNDDTEASEDDDRKKDEDEDRDEKPEPAATAEPAPSASESASAEPDAGTPEDAGVVDASAPMPTTTTTVRPITDAGTTPPTTKPDAGGGTQPGGATVQACVSQCQQELASCLGPAGQLPTAVPDMTKCQAAAQRCQTACR